MKRESNIERIQEVIEFVSKQLSEDDAGRLSMGSSTPAAPILVSEDQSTACTEKSDPKSNSSSNQSEDQLLSDLIANCVAALFMIQVIAACIVCFSGLHFNLRLPNLLVGHRAVTFFRSESPLLVPFSMQVLFVRFTQLLLSHYLLNFLMLTVLAPVKFINPQRLLSNPSLVLSMN